MVDGGDHVLCDAGACQHSGASGGHDVDSAERRFLVVLSHKQRMVGGYDGSCFQLLFTPFWSWEECYTEDGVLLLSNGLGLGIFLAEFFPESETLHDQLTMVVEEYSHSVDDDDLDAPLPWVEPRDPPQPR